MHALFDVELVQVARHQPWDVVCRRLLYLYQVVVLVVKSSILVPTYIIFVFIIICTSICYDDRAVLVDPGQLETLMLHVYIKWVLKFESLLLALNSPFFALFQLGLP